MNPDKELWVFETDGIVLVESLEIQLGSCASRTVGAKSSHDEPHRNGNAAEALLDEAANGRYEQHVKLLAALTGEVSIFHFSSAVDPALVPIFETMGAWGPPTVGRGELMEGTKWGWLRDDAEGIRARARWLRALSKKSPGRERTRFFLRQMRSVDDPLPDPTTEDGVPGNEAFFLAVLTSPGFDADRQMIADALCKGLGEEGGPIDGPVAYGGRTNRVLIPWLLRPENRAIAVAVRARIERLNQEYINWFLAGAPDPETRSHYLKNLTDPQGYVGKATITEFLEGFDRAAKQ